MNIFALVGLLACWNIYLISKSVWHPGARSAVPLAQGRAHCASDRHNYLTYYRVSFELSMPPRGSSTVPTLRGEAGAFPVQLTFINVDISFRHTGKSSQQSTYTKMPRTSMYKYNVITDPHEIPRCVRVVANRVRTPLSARQWKKRGIGTQEPIITLDTALCIASCTKNDQRHRGDAISRAGKMVAW